MTNLDTLSREMADLARAHQLGAKDIRERLERVLEGAFRVGSWTAEESDGMLVAFDRAKDKHGARETLFAVGAWLLRHRLQKALESK